MDSWGECLNELHTVFESTGQNYFSEVYKIYTHSFIKYLNLARHRLGLGI